MQKFIAATVAATMALTAVAVTTPKAEARDRTGGYLAAGIVGLAAGAIIGGVIANNQEHRRQKRLRAYYQQQQYGYGGYGYDGYSNVQYYQPQRVYPMPQGYYRENGYVPQQPYYYQPRQQHRPRPVYSSPYGSDGYGYYQRQQVCWKGYDYDNDGRRVFKKECGYR